MENAENNAALRCQLNGLLYITPTTRLKLARDIKDAIDEEEVENSETTQMLAFAQEVVTNEGSEEDASSIIPKGKNKRPASIKEFYADDNEAWVRKPSASTNLKKPHA
ncbi:MutS protein 1 [Conoideocrella luteorostrata]|uniref:MutS protein 1 n=1 Tax=Conoideocrella luteorostrata TaxID=1105319 RepID=A0AAJ0CM12_9HYPO|nr:MutS protein 1 [Conoideocrella luteorostrata]